MIKNLNLCENINNLYDFISKDEFAQYFYTTVAFFGAKNADHNLNGLNVICEPDYLLNDIEKNLFIGNYSFKELEFLLYSSQNDKFNLYKWILVNLTFLLQKQEKISFLDYLLEIFQKLESKYLSLREEKILIFISVDFFKKIASLFNEEFIKIEKIMFEIIRWFLVDSIHTQIYLIFNSKCDYVDAINYAKKIIKDNLLFEKVIIQL